jgi:hypothetical protein
MPVTISLLPPKNERQQIDKDFSACRLDNQTAMQWCHPIIIQSAAFMSKNASDDIVTASALYVLQLNFTNMPAESLRSDFFLACNSEVNI